jgi:hypothetical protein
LDLEAKGSALMTIGGELLVTLLLVLTTFGGARAFDVAAELSGASDWSSLNFLFICRNLALAVSAELYPTFLATTFQSTLSICQYYPKFISRGRSNGGKEFKIGKSESILSKDIYLGPVLHGH